MLGLLILLSSMRFLFIYTNRNELQLPPCSLLAIFKLLTLPARDSLKFWTALAGKVIDSELIFSFFRIVLFISLTLLYGLDRCNVGCFLLPVQLWQLLTNGLIFVFRFSRFMNCGVLMCDWHCEQRFSLLWTKIMINTHIVVFWLITVRPAKFPLCTLNVIVAFVSLYWTDWWM